MDGHRDNTLILLYALYTGSRSAHDGAMDRSRLLRRFRKARAFTTREVAHAFFWYWVESQAGIVGIIVLSLIGWASNVILSWEAILPILIAAFFISGWMNYRAHKKEAAVIKQSVEEIMGTRQADFVAVAREELRAVFREREKEINEEAAAGAARSWAQTMAYALSMTPEERARAERDRRARVDEMFDLLDECSDGTLSRLLEERKQQEQGVDEGDQ